MLLILGRFNNYVAEYDGEKEVKLFVNYDHEFKHVKRKVQSYNGILKAKRIEKLKNEVAKSDGADVETSHYQKEYVL